MKTVKGGLSAPKGFETAALACGIKKSGRNDLALLFSGVPALCAGTFTANRMRSGSVVLSERRVRKGIAQAVIVNSGNANCCAGERELSDAGKITNTVAKRLNLSKDRVLIASTGIIGKPLPLLKITKAIAHLTKELSGKNADRFSKAIMTTDKVHKEIAVRIKIKGRRVKVAGAAKGSGMICPNMATMLAFFTTDAVVEKAALKTAFKECVSRSFNRITVDGDMSTNDTALILANGLAGNDPIKKGTQDYFRFFNALKFVSGELARKIVLDGEGATRFVEILVKGARDSAGADALARHVADSSLVKTMIAGGDPNWGRVAASIGSSGIELKKDAVDIYFGKKKVMRNGSGTDVTRKALLRIFKKKEIKITIDLKSGSKTGRVWTCDLTGEYVRINAEYET